MKIILFGARQFASLAWYCVAHDSSDDVVGFTVDREYLVEHELQGLPVVAFEEIEARYAPDQHAMLFPLGPHGENRLKRDRFLSAKERGYSIATYISSRAVVWPDLDIGEAAIVFEHAVIQPFVKVGVNTIVRSSVQLSHHVEIGDHCFVAPSACVGGGTVIGERCTIGLNATVREGLRVAPGCVIAAGAVLTGDTDPNGLYAGVPARRVKTLGEGRSSLSR
jgi:sugar O-acyltransferase (sialic acid O-acetyltransferase NeuD family)